MLTVEISYKYTRPLSYIRLNPWCAEQGYSKKKTALFLSIVLVQHHLCQSLGFSQDDSYTCTEDGQAVKNMKQ